MLEEMEKMQYARRSNEFFWRERTFKGLSRSLARDYAIRVSGMFQRPSQKGFLRCLFLHNVFDDQLAGFERQLRTLQSIGTFVDTPTCLAMLNSEQPIDEPFFHLSMDDGYRNNFTNAFPILERLKIPAIVFVASDLIECGWEKSEEFCRNAGCQGVIEMANWSDLRNFVSAGYEVGSHTRSHARFSDISTDNTQMSNEIGGSKAVIEDKLGISCDYISWPYGTPSDCDPASLRFVKEAGYKACFSAVRGQVIAGETSPFLIPRHQFEADWPISHLRFFARGGKEPQELPLDYLRDQI